MNTLNEDDFLEAIYSERMLKKYLSMSSSFLGYVGSVDYDSNTRFSLKFLNKDIISSDFYWIFH